MRGSKRLAALVSCCVWGCGPPSGETPRHPGPPSVPARNWALGSGERYASLEPLAAIRPSPARDIYDGVEAAPSTGDLLYEALVTAEHPPPPLPRGSTVLTVGDSMAQALGVSLGRRLKQRGLRHFMAAKAGTRLSDFAGPRMALWQDLAFHDPDLVIISLGGNEVTLSEPKHRVWAIEKLLELVGDRPCIWVATPLWPGFDDAGILEVIRAHVGHCRYVDTNALIPHMERTGDRIHPTWPERENWADLMVRWLLHNRRPDGPRPWSLREPTEDPPPGSEAWLEVR